MKKLIFSAASSTLLATSILTPLASASESQEPTNQDHNSQIINKTNKLPENPPKNFNEDRYVDDVLSSQNINPTEARQHALAEKQNRGKVGMTVKTAMKSIKKYKTQIQNTINSAIDKLPLSQQVKAHWKKVITVDALLEALGHYTNFGDNVEGAITNALTDLGVPGWIATGLAKTITFAIPVL